MKFFNRFALGVVMGTVISAFGIAVCIYFAIDHGYELKISTFVMLPFRCSAIQVIGYIIRDYYVVKKHKFLRGHDKTILFVRKTKVLKEDFIRRLIYAVMILVITASALLTVGIMTRSHKLMLPWLILHGIDFVLSLLGVLSFAVMNVDVKYVFIGILIIGIKGICLCFLYTLFEDILVKSIVKKIISLDDMKAINL